MAKLLVLDFSMYGHLETMTNAVADGARSVSGVDVTLSFCVDWAPARWPGNYYYVPQHTVTSRNANRGCAL